MNKQESVQLAEEMGLKENELCPKCYSILIKKDGVYTTRNHARHQYYRCIECDKRFIIKDKFYHSKTPKKIMILIWKISKENPNIPHHKIASLVRQETNYNITKKGVKLTIKRFKEGWKSLNYAQAVRKF